VNSPSPRSPFCETPYFRFISQSPCNSGAELPGFDIAAMGSSGPTPLTRPVSVKPVQHSFMLPSTQSTEDENVADSAAISEQVNLYFPQLQAHHAPKREEPTCSARQCQSNSTSVYTCHDCFFMEFYCAPCMVSLHQDNPLHHIRLWDKGCLDSASLIDLGLEITLPHSDGTPCNGATGHQRLKVFHTNGMHRVAVKVCKCKKTAKGDNAAFRAQLAASRLFPATHKDPVTAFSFDLIDLFNALNLEGALNVKQFLDGIICRSPTKIDLADEVR